MFAKLESQKSYADTNKENILNPYVSFMNHKGTQALQDVLVQESIQMRGIQLYYLPREYADIDLILGEDVNSKFNQAWPFAAYLNTFDSFSGQQDFFSKFGYQANDEITITVNPELFNHQVNQKEPASGDLIYLPLDNSLFEITWVEPRDPFYSVGKNSMRKITAQKFIYSGEQIKPVLNKGEDIVDEFDDFDLEPLRELDGLADTAIEQYQEDNQFAREAEHFVDPFVVVNNRGNTNPFDDFM